MEKSPHPERSREAAQSKDEARQTADTIFAPATAPGRAGVAIMRISGPAARAALAALSCPVPPPRHAARARFIERATGEAIDDGLALFFPGPASATGEDVAELHLHGGRAVVEAVAAALAGLPACAWRSRANSPAAPSSTASSISPRPRRWLISSPPRPRRSAAKPCASSTASSGGSTRPTLLRASAHVEAAIDFPEEGLPETLDAGARAAIEELIGEIDRHLADNRRGEILRDGVSVAIIGPPNAGKSSLINALSRRDVAITAASAGTTRDIIEVHLNLAGYPVILADTAGLREAGDAVEAEGVRRARARAAADLTVLVFDIARPEESAGLAGIVDAATIVVANKLDLIGAATRAIARDKFPPGTLAISTVTGEGVATLLDRIAATVKERYAGAAGPVMTRSRHRAALGDCLAALRRSLPASLPELAAEDLRLAIRALGRNHGRADVEDILDIIFRDFCIGK